MMMNEPAGGRLQICTREILASTPDRFLWSGFFFIAYGFFSSK
jgi:hypothetical protein